MDNFSQALAWCAIFSRYHAKLHRYTVRLKFPNTDLGRALFFHWYRSCLGGQRAQIMAGHYVSVTAKGIAISMPLEGVYESKD